MRRSTALTIAAATLMFATSAQAAPEVIQGEYTLSVTITLVTAIPAGGSASCSLSISVAGDAAGINQESVTAPMLVTGSTGKCSLVIPYHWALDTPGTDLLTAFYSATISGATAESPEQRSGTHGLPSMAVPATGTRTNLTAITRL